MIPQKPEPSWPWESASYCQWKDEKEPTNCSNEQVIYVKVTQNLHNSHHLSKSVYWASTSPSSKSRVTHLKLLPAVWTTHRSSLLLSKKVMNHHLALQPSWSPAPTHRGRYLEVTKMPNVLDLTQASWDTAYHFLLLVLSLSSCLFKHMDTELLTFTGKTNKIMWKQERGDVRLQLAPLICGNLISARVAELPGKVLTIK